VTVPFLFSFCRYQVAACLRSQGQLQSWSTICSSSSLRRRNERNNERIPSSGLTIPLFLSVNYQVSRPSSLSPSDEVFIVSRLLDSDVSLRRTTQSTKLAAAEHAKKDVKTLEQMVQVNISNIGGIRRSASHELPSIP